MYDAVCRLTSHFTALLNRSANSGENAPNNAEMPMYHGETLLMLAARWRKLQKELLKRKGAAPTYDLSKVPDIYDCITYDCKHNMAALGDPPILLELLVLVRPLAQLLIPLEYGGAVDDALDVATRVQQLLLRKVCAATCQMRQLRIAVHCGSHLPNLAVPRRHAHGQARARRRRDRPPRDGAHI